MKEENSPISPVSHGPSADAPIRNSDKRSGPPKGVAILLIPPILVVALLGWGIIRNNADRKSEQHRQELQSENLKLMSQKGELEAKNLSLIQEVASHKSDVEEAKNTIREAAEAEAALLGLKKEKSDIKLWLESHRADVTNLTTTILALETKTTILRETIEPLENIAIEVLESERKRTDVEKKIADANAILKAAMIKKDDAETQEAETMKNLTRLEKDITTEQANLKKLRQLAQQRRQAMADDMSSKEEELKKVESQVVQAEKKKAALVGQFDLMTITNKAVADKKIILDLDVNKLGGQKNILKENIKTLSLDLQAKKVELNAFELQDKKAKGIVAALQTDIDTAKVEYQTITNQIARAKADGAKANRESGRAKLEAENAKAEWAKAQAGLAAARTTLTEKQASITEANKENARLTEANKALGPKTTAGERKWAAAEQKAAITQRDLVVAQGNLDAILKKLAGIDFEIEEKTRKEAKLAEKIDLLEKTIEGLLKENGKLEAIRSPPKPNKDNPPAEPALSPANKPQPVPAPTGTPNN